MDWELSKENFQPLKQGRAPAQLKLQAAPAGLSGDQEEQRRWGHWGRSRAGALVPVAC